ncbi:MAG: C40 family peptidase [Cytophagales bacterium]|nr:C40 family peptidase [Cytophagales bacterium]
MGNNYFAKQRIFIIKYCIISCNIIVILTIPHCRSSKSTSNTTIYKKFDKHTLITEAKKQIGKKYKIGGCSPNTGFDCSGFTKYVYEQFGVHLPKTAANQYDEGRAISTMNADKGDLIFFKGSDKNGREVGHVGIVVQRHGSAISFIHASTSKGIMISSLDEKYFKERFIKIKRIK